MPNALYRVPDDLRNALSGPQDVMGMDPNVNRLSLLPRYSAQDGVVAPQWLYDLARAAMAPGNALMGHNTTPEEAFNFAGNLVGTGIGARVGSPSSPGEIGMQVYHGSPHRINNVTPEHPMGQFDLAKIGTGEGAQAYGHGIYAAESPEVARGYMSVDNPAVAVWQTLYGKKVGGKGGAALTKWANPDEGDLAPAIARINDFLQRPYLNYPEHEYLKVEALRDLDTLTKLSGKVKPNKGHFYTVDLPDSHIAKMLDWDAPLSQQPEAVRRMSESLRIPARTLKKLNAEDVSDFVGFHSDGTGEDFYNVLTDPLGVNMTDQAASKVLRDAGIPGIKYFDGGSRAAGEGTRNFVIFDPSIAKILSRE